MVFYLTREEVKSMFDASDNLRNTILMRMLYWGPRISTIVGDKKNKLPGIHHGDIDFDAGEIKVLSKGKKERAIVMDKETLNMLKFFCQEKGIKRGRILKIHRTSAHRIIKKIAKRAGLERAPLISCHKWRHTFAIHALNRYHFLMKDGGKFNIALVCKQLGHADIITTWRFYAKYVTTDLKEAAGLMGN